MRKYPYFCLLLIAGLWMGCEEPENSGYVPDFDLTRSFMFVNDSSHAVTVTPVDTNAMPVSAQTPTNSPGVPVWEERTLAKRGDETTYEYFKFGSSADSFEFDYRPKSRVGFTVVERTVIFEDN